VSGSDEITRRAVDRLFGWLCRLLLPIFFRRVEVVGRDHIPQRGPFIVVANHVNGLIDPMFVLGPLRLPARMLGKATLWRIPGLRQLLELVGGIPVARHRDGAVDPKVNLEAFAASHEHLRRGGVMAIFPEGISHDQPQLQPLRTGAARIAIEAELAFGPLGLKMVPVGLLFEERGALRSRALVVVGEAIDPAPEIEAARRSREDEHAAVRALTARLSAALEAVTLNYASWDEARLVELGVDIYDRDTPWLPHGRALAAEFRARRALEQGMTALRATHPAAVAAAIDAAREYERLLRAAQLDDEQVVARYPLGLALEFAARTLARLLLLAPAALLGLLLNWMPWLLVHLVASRFRDEPNQISTYQLFPGIVIYPLSWLAESWIVGEWLGTLSAIAILALAPFAGWVTLRFRERRQLLWRETRAFVLLRGRRRFAAELRERRAAVAREVDRLVELWRRDQGLREAIKRS
jgi:1-acyl-sn-glycerol-3-phosphate acyltransferase